MPRETRARRRWRRGWRRPRRARTRWKHLSSRVEEMQGTVRELEARLKDRRGDREAERLRAEVLALERGAPRGWASSRRASPTSWRLSATRAGRRATRTRRLLTSRRRENRNAPPLRKASKARRTPSARFARRSPRSEARVAEAEADQAAMTRALADLAGDEARAAADVRVANDAETRALETRRAALRSRRDGGYRRDGGRDDDAPSPSRRRRLRAPRRREGTGLRLRDGARWSVASPRRSGCWTPRAPSSR